MIWRRSVDIGTPPGFSDSACRDRSAGVPIRLSHGGIGFALHLDGGGTKPTLSTLAVILLVLWLLGLVSGYTLGNFIYVLLVIAIVLFLVDVIGGRRTVV